MPYCFPKQKPYTKECHHPTPLTALTILSVVSWGKPRGEIYTTPKTLCDIFFPMGLCSLNSLNWLAGCPAETPTVIILAEQRRTGGKFAQIHTVFMAERRHLALKLRGINNGELGSTQEGG